MDALTDRFRAGQAQRVDVLRQRQLLIDTRQRLEDLKTSTRLTDHRLAVLTGRLPGTEPVPQEAELPPVPPLPDTGIPLEILNRPGRTDRA